MLDGWNGRATARRHRGGVVLALLLVAGALATPARADAQSWLDNIKKKVTDGVAQKVDEHRARAESTVVNTTAKTADSALTKTNRGLGATMDKANDIANKGINGVEGGVSSVFAGVMTTPDQFAADLKAGRVTIKDIEFGGEDASTLKPTSDVVLRKLAAAFTDAPGRYLVESHVNMVGDPDIEQALSDRRSAAVLARLVSLGVAEDRLSAKGFGATRPADGNLKSATTNARIEVSRLP